MASAIYYLRARHLEVEFDTTEDAARFLAILSEHDELTPNGIWDGNRIIFGEELNELLRPHRERYTAAWESISSFS